MISLLKHLRVSFFLGQVPAQAASSQTAEEMALLAYNRALKLSKPGLDFGFIGIFVVGLWILWFYHVHASLS